MSAKCLILTAFLGLLVPSDSKTLSQRCSGWTPEDCVRVKGCMNCYDGQRIDCFPENSSTLYGSLWCETKPEKGNPCAGKEEEECGNGKGCVYCKSAAVGNQCYTTDEAKKLPAAIFSCSWPSWSTKSSGPPAEMSEHWLDTTY